MSCNIKAFRDNKIKEAIDLVYNPQAVSYRIHRGNSIIISPMSGSKIKTQNQAFRAAEAMEKKIAKEFGKDYMFDVYGKWTTIHKSPSDVRLEITIPNNLLRAYEAKETKKSTEYYATQTAVNEQQELDFNTFFDMPVTAKEDQINAFEFVNYKNNLITKAEAKIKDLQAQRKQKYSSALSAKINTLNTLKEKLQEDIRQVQKSNDTLRTMEDQISQDLNTLDLLLKNDENIEDLHSAEQIISFYIEMTDYKANSGNKFLNISEIYDQDNNLILDPDIKNLLDNTLIKINQMHSKLGLNKRKYLQRLVDNSDQIQKLQEARKKLDSTVGDFEILELLKEFDDISWIDENFLTIDKQFGKEDSLLAQLMKIELEFRRSEEKSKSANLIRAINVALENANSSLSSLSSPVKTLFGTITNRDFTPFYRKNALGNISGVLVSKYSDKWDRAKKAMFYRANLERKKGGSVSMNKANKMEYDWIDSNANFFDITKVFEIVQDPEFSPNIRPEDRVTEAESEAYKQSVIAIVGEEFYNRLVQEQIAHLRDFETLPNSSKVYSNPYALLRSKEAGQGGKDYLGRKEINISPRFNSYYPKKQTQIYQGNQLQTVDSGYYDSNFEMIEQNESLLNLWKAFEKSAEYINDNIADGTNNLQHGSVLAMKKSFSEILLSNTKTGVAPQLSEWLTNAFKGMFVQTKNKKNASEGTSINKSQFKTNEEKIKKLMLTVSLKLERLHDIKFNDSIDLLTAPQEVLDFFKEELNSESNRHRLIDTLEKQSVTPYELSKMYITDQVIEENSTNLPVIMRAYVEMTAEYKAQKDSQPKIEIYKQFYDGIKKKEVNSKSGWVARSIDKIRTDNIVGLERTAAKKRLNYWYNKNVRGTVDSPNSWVIITSSYEKHEKALLEELKEKLKDPKTTEEQIALINNEIEKLGMNITLSAAFNAVVNKFTLFRGLAYSVKSSTINRFQGWFQGAVNDGKYWEEGNFDIANRFITRKALRYSSLHSEYKKEINKTKLMINALNILQDATNELDRARESTGQVGWKKKLNPYYLTEYTEWHNQTPQILAMLMDKTIEDENGNVKKVFDGKSFPAHEIKEGFLVLKPEFARKGDNIETWQNFSNASAANNKLYMSEVIGIVNGDYSKTGSIKAKKNVFGRSAMLFKSWLPNYIWNRIASEQANLILGNPGTKGIYSSHRRSTLATLLGTAGFLATGPVGAAIGIIAGIGVGSYLKKKNDPLNLLDDINMIKETTDMAMAMLKRFGTPVNMLTGNRLYKKKHDLSKITVSKQDEQNLNAILSELSVLLSLALFKVMMKSMLGNDDEEEPKTLPGGEPNPYYLENIQSDKTKMLHNLIENESTRLIGDIVGIQSGQFYIDTYKNFQVVKTLEDSYKLVDALYRLTKEEDRISTGINAGDSRVGNSFKKLLIPGIFKSPVTLGYGPSMEQEYNNREFFDTYFYSDYKKDRKTIKKEREKERANLTEEFRISLGYDEETNETKKILDDAITPVVNEMLNITIPYPHRLLYDKEQKLEKDKAEGSK